MSTPPSFIDDGVSLTHRLPSLPHSHHHKTPRPAPSETSAYTGSYFDDGLDLLPPPSGHGLGTINPRFYKSRKQRDSQDKGVWSDNIARAVGGDVARSLARVRGLGGISVRKAVGSCGGEDGDEERAKRRRRKGVVCVPKPVKWGTFVIKGEDGRVVVVGEDGEWDSGSFGRGQEGGEGRKSLDRDEGEKMERKGLKWVRAASTVSEVATSRASKLVPKTRRARGTVMSANAHKPRRCESRTGLQNDTRELDAVTEAEYESESDGLVTLSPPASPTDFFMTGGISGWPSRTASPMLASPIVPHAITWEATSPPAGSVPRHSTTQATSTRSTNGKKEIEDWNLTRSSHDGWPAVKVVSSRLSTASRDRVFSRAKSRSRNPSPASVVEVEGSSGEVRSANQPPDIVEVIYDETPPGEVSYSQSGWYEPKVPSEGGAWDETFAAESSVGSAEHDKAVSDLGWGSALDKKIKDSPAWEAGSGHSYSRSHAKSRTSWSRTGSDAGSAAMGHDGWDDDDQQKHDGEWDGFERPQTSSEVSVYGGSVQSGLSRRSHRSQHSARDQGSQRSPRSHHSHHLRRSPESRRSRHSELDWGGEGERSKIHWSGSEKAVVQNWAE